MLHPSSRKMLRAHTDHITGLLVNDIRSHGCGSVFLDHRGKFENIPYPHSTIPDDAVKIRCETDSYCSLLWLPWRTSPVALSCVAFDRAPFALARAESATV